MASYLHLHILHVFVYAAFFIRLDHSAMLSVAVLPLSRVHVKSTYCFPSAYYFLKQAD